MNDRTRDRIPRIRFAGSLRPSQRDAIKVVKRQLKRGKHRLHIVAPPGAGKTVLGLYIWAHLVQKPAVVLSPNSAIQAQWAARLDLFNPVDPALVSTDPQRICAFTSLTYQSVTLPGRGGGSIDAAAIELWQQKLLESGEVHDLDSARIWIVDLKRHNPAYYDARLSTYRKAVRDEIARSGEALSTIHKSALETLHRMRDRGIGLVILDECHHLLGHWGRVLADAHELLEGPVVLGLTATPPDRRGRDDVDVERYDAFFGPVDFEVPVPTLVKEGHLAPYQDLAYLVRPSERELRFVAEADREFRNIVKELCALRPADAAGGGPRAEPLVEWTARTLAERPSPAGSAMEWRSFHRRHERFADMSRLFLHRMKRPLPAGVPGLDSFVLGSKIPELEVLVPVLDRYLRHALRRSAHPADHALAEEAISRLRMLGLQVTETGTQPCASPVGRVLAYAGGKIAALSEILRAERQALGEGIRAVVITDYEKTSAVTAEISGILDQEAGGAIAAFRSLVKSETSEALDPILVTGSTVLVDDDLLPRFMTEARAWLRARGLDAELSDEAEDGFHIILGRGRDWSPRTYVSLITELFQRGITKCLVGTRGLLGEGWDASTVNVLIDLTTVTTSMSVNQLRGRSLRLDSNDPKKVADNWDVICVAGEFAKGLDDYHRFIAKHRTLFGVTDDGAVEKGVGHVHAAFTEIEPEGVEGSMGLINAEMLSRAARRAECRKHWRIGEPFRGEPVKTIEVAPGGAREGGFPPFSGRRDVWTDHSLTLAIARCVLDALREAELIDLAPKLQTSERAGGYVRVLLSGAGSEDGALFITSLHEAMGALDRPRYVIPRQIDVYHDTWLSRIMPELVARFLRKRRRRFAMLHAVPSALAKNKSLVAIYERHWNRHVSPGEAVYALQGEGEELVEKARREGLAPRTQIHEKEAFL